MLNNPWGIFVDINFDLYVADSFNHRIQRFSLDRSNEQTVAGKNAASTDRLFYPSGIVLDADGHLFIVDTGNHRIVVSDSSGLQCLVGCSDAPDSAPGSAPNQLNYPTTLSFDSYGNMIVVDTGNDRIQKFLLATNSCSKYEKRRCFTIFVSFDMFGQF
jgi:sugar lactone lactonase YvrE